ncbi:unnamed protein product, partial [marine sediment metagenome]
MKQFFGKRWHSIPVALLSALLVVCLLAGGVLAALPSETQTITQTIEPAPTYTLMTTVNPTRVGYVTVSSLGGVDYDEPATVIEGTELNIVATPGSGWEFVEWTGDTDTIADVNAASTTITMDDDYSIVANFANYGSITAGDITLNGVVAGTGYFSQDFSGAVSVIVEDDGVGKYLHIRLDKASAGLYTEYL